MLLLLTAGQTALAANGTWFNLAGGDYNVAGNWQSNTVASGAGFTANFNTLDIASDVNISLETPLTIGNMLFGDIGLGTGGSWAITTNTLADSIITLDNGGNKPNLTVNQLTPASFDDAFIGPSVAGTNGFAKLGPGILTLGPGTTNTLIGGIDLNAGTLRLQSALPRQAYSLAGGTTLVTVAPAGSNTDPMAAAMTIAAGQTATVRQTSAGTMWPISGNGSTLNYIANHDAGLNEMRGNWAAAGNLAALNISTDPSVGSQADFRFDQNRDPGNFADNSFQNTAVNFDNVNVRVRTRSNGNTIPLGSLSGTSTATLSGGDAGSAVRWEVGSLNTSTEFAGSIIGNNAAGGVAGVSLNKVGTGTLTLSGPLTGPWNNQGAVLARQGGVLRVTTGTLKITGATSIPAGAGTSYTTIDVLPGAIFDVSGAPGTFENVELQKIQGGGTVVGPYNLAAGQLRPGDVGAPTAANEGNMSAGVTPTAGTLTFNGNLQLNGGEIVYDMSVTPASGNDLISVTGQTALNSGKISPNFLAGVPTSGTYTVLTSSGGFTGSASNITIDFPGRTPDQVAQQSGNSLVFNAAAVVPSANLIWTGASNSNWDNEISQNWTNGGNPDRFYMFDNVTFNESAGNKSVTIVGAVQPTSVVINNTSPYSFTGTGAITGTTGLTKSGSGNLTMQVPNTFSGPVDLSGGGTIDVGTVNGAFGTGAMTIGGVSFIGQNAAGFNNSGMTVTAATTNTVTIDGGTGSGNTVNVPTLSGGGTLTLTSTVADKWFAMNGAPTFSGTINLTGVDNGTPNHYRFTTTGGGTTFPNAVVNMNDARISNRQGGAANTTATFEFGELHGDDNSRMNSFEGGGSAISANWQIGALNTNSDFAGIIADGGASVSHVTKVGTGTLTLSGANTYTGVTSIAAGTLSLTTPSLQATADVSMASTATFNLAFPGENLIRSLFIDGKPAPIGTWGSPTSNATNKRSYFSGNGVLNVQSQVLIGDYNNNGTVDAADFVVWQNSVGSATLTNRDPYVTGNVGAADLAAWRARFGISLTPPPGAGGNDLFGLAVPEPSSLLLLLFGMSAAAAGRARRR